MRSTSRVAWIVMAVVAVVALGIGVTVERPAQSTEERVSDLAESIRCPTCRSQSVAESEAPIAREIRGEISQRIEAGESDDEIRDFLASRYGQEVLLTPPASGIAGLVWVIPVVAVVAALVGLWFAFRRWREEPTVHASAADRELVESALHAGAGSAAPAGDEHADEHDDQSADAEGEA